MFLIYGGHAFLMKFTYDQSTYKFTTVFEQVFNQTNQYKFWPMQGMRVYEDTPNQLYSLSSASCPQNGDCGWQFSLLSTDFNGNLKMANFYPANHDNYTGFQSHPYALTPSSQSTGGMVIAGLAIQTNGYPEGRAISISSDGSLLWDIRFRYPGPVNQNTECYGISICTDQGYIITCGTGIEPPEASFSGKRALGRGLGAKQL